VEKTRRESARLKNSASGSENIPFEKKDAMKHQLQKTKWEWFPSPSTTKPNQILKTGRKHTCFSPIQFRLLHDSTKQVSQTRLLPFAAPRGSLRSRGTEMPADEAVEQPMPHLGVLLLGCHL